MYKRSGDMKSEGLGNQLNQVRLQVRLTGTKTVVAIDTHTMFRETA